jgi:twitching motility protein PilU
LFRDGKIDLKTALSYADSRSNLEWKINFGGGVTASADSKHDQSLQFPAGGDLDDLPEVN